MTVDYLTHKRLRNKDLAPQYFVRNTHPKIIDEEMYEKVQQEKKRRRGLRKDPERKYRQVYSGKSPFSNRLFCGVCGLPANRRRLTTQKNNEKRLFSAFQCRGGHGFARGKEKSCGNQYVWEDHMEIAFMKVLHELKHNQEAFIEDARRTIADYTLSREEQKRLADLNQQIDVVTDRITELAGKTSGKVDGIYDATLRHLIYEQEILEQERDSYNDSLHEQKYFEDHLEKLQQHLDQLDTQGPFDPHVFRDVIEKGVIYPNWYIKFHFKCGLTRRVAAKTRKSPKQSD